VKPARLLASLIFASAPVAALAALGAGCGDAFGTAQAADSSVASDSLPDTKAQDDARRDADGAGDAGLDASASVALLVAFSGGAEGGVFGASYQGGGWKAPVRFAPEGYAQGGGGIAASPAGEGYVAFRPGSTNKLLTTTWTGTWPVATVLGTPDVNYIGHLAATPKSILLAAATVPSGGIDGGAGGIFLRTLDYASGQWSAAQPTGAGDFNSQPAVAATAAGLPLVVFAGAGTDYVWTQRLGSGWSTPAPLAGITFFSATRPPVPTLVARTGADQVVGIFLTGTESTRALSAATFSAGSWSPGRALAMDLGNGGGDGRMSFAAALPDGRVAVAYETTSAGVKVGFFDGATWSAFAAVPGVTVGFSRFAIARGTNGAILELVFIDGNDTLRHARLLPVGGWTAPVLIDGSREYFHVAITAF
jgi:hypothetical protein